MTAPDKILIVFGPGGEGWILTWEANEMLNDFLRDCGRDLGRIGGIDYLIPEHEGVWVFEMKLADDGPSDWPGERETCIQFSNPAPPTEEEWKAFREDELIWSNP